MTNEENARRIEADIERLRCQLEKVEARLRRHPDGRKILAERWQLRTELRFLEDKRAALFSDAPEAINPFDLLESAGRLLADSFTTWLSGGRPDGGTLERAASSVREARSIAALEDSRTRNAINLQAARFRQAHALISKQAPGPRAKVVQGGLPTLGKRR